MDSYLQLESNIVTWAKDQSLLSAIVVVGSRARRARAADHLSDLDLILFTSNPEAYEADSAWIGSIADIWLAVRDLTGHGDPEWIVLFDGGFKADFIIVHASAEIPIPAIIEASPYKSVFERGFRLLFNRTVQNSKIRPHEAAQKSIELPSTADLSSTVERALIDASRLAVFLRRNDLWRSHQVLDIAIRGQLLKLVEWHTQSRTPNFVDTWYDGRFVDTWADPQIVAKLSGIFATYDAHSLQNAFVKVVDLIDALADETAKQINCHYPSQGQARTLSWLRDLSLYKMDGRNRS